MSRYSPYGSRLEAEEAQAYWKEKAEEQQEEDRLFREAREREYAANLAANLAINPYYGLLWRQKDARKAFDLLLKQETDPARRAAMQATFEKEQADELQASREFDQKKREEAALRVKERRDAEEAHKKEAEAERSYPQVLYAAMLAIQELLRGHIDASDEHLKKETDEIRVANKFPNSEEERPFDGWHG